MHNLKHLYKGSLGGSVCLHCRRFATKKTHYEVLGVSKTATQKEIKSAYIELSKKYHPDTAGARSKKKFTEINEAYSVLGKSLSRREYDNKIAFEKAQTSSSNTYGPYSRPPGSGPASYPPPGYKYGQSYDRRDNRYGSDFSSSYSEEQRKREEAIRKMRQKLHEERMRKFNEFERDIDNVTTAGQRIFKSFLDFYLRFVFLSAIFMTFYALSTFEPRSNSEGPINWRKLHKHSPLISVQLMWIMIILSLQFIVGVAMHLRSNSVGGRKFRHQDSQKSKKSSKFYKFVKKHRSEVYHSVNLSVILIVMLFGWFIEISREEVMEFYRRMGYFRAEEGEFKDLLEMFAINMLVIVLFAFLALRFFFISSAIEKRRERERYWESPDSELRRRYEYFYGEHGEENRRRAKERAFGKKTREQEASEVRRVVIICAVIALASTILQFIANGQIKVSNSRFSMGADGVPLSPVAVVLLGLFFISCLSTGFVFRKTSWHLSNIKKLDTRSRADLNRSPSDEIKAKIDHSIRIDNIDKDVKDITPPTA